MTMFTRTGKWLLIVTAALALSALWHVATARAASGDNVFANTAARTKGQSTEALVLLADAGSFPAVPLVGRRGVEIQNLGPNAIYCNLGTATTGVSVGKGRKLGSAGSVDSLWSIDASDAIAIRCIAATAAQLTTAGTWITEIQ